MKLNNNFQQNMNLEIKFTKIIKAILGNYFIVKDIEEDLERGTDFLILKINPFRIACRLRRYKFIKLYSDEFTIRASRSSGIKTEFDKIIDGYVDYILYGFINEDETKIIKYFIGDLKIFREYLPFPCATKKNKDYKASTLYAFKIKDLPDDFILKKY